MITHFFFVAEEPWVVEPWDHHDVTRFSLAWAATKELHDLRTIVGRSLFATFRGQQQPRSEPVDGFQLHQLELQGCSYIKVLFKDSRECKLRLLRYMMFEEFKTAIAERRIGLESSFRF